MNGIVCSGRGFWWCGILIGSLVWVAGCAQSTETPVKQLAPAAAEQDQATQGSQVYVWILNGPGREGVPAPGPEGAAVSKLSAGVDATDVDSPAAFNQAGIRLTINTGSTTPTATGTASPSVSPSQDVTARVGVSAVFEAIVQGALKALAAQAATPSVSAGEGSASSAGGPQSASQPTAPTVDVRPGGKAAGEENGDGGGG
jgi:hypothetical protein